MKRTAAWVATLVPFVLAAPSALLIAAGPATAPSTAPAAAGDKAPSTPAELLASKGLTKAANSNSYVLRAERELADGLRQIAQAQGKMTTENKNREKYER